ncbi:MAG: Holliday junction resolvase RuvX [Armatimonadetes bacterium]|nr:Holliday junction resolvase RuvX [Armatimonadota bacterium]
MRALGVDLGTTRIGIAVGEKEFGIVTPRPALKALGKLSLDAETIAAKARDEGVDLVVLGHPLQPDGSPSRLSGVCEKLADLIREKGVTVELQDEAFTSVEAEQQLNRLDLKGSDKRKARDGEAAAKILERYFAAH